MKEKVFIFGLGYVGLSVARQLVTMGYEVFGTTQKADKKTLLEKENIFAFLWNGEGDHNIFLEKALSESDYVLSTIAPNEKDDFVYRTFKKEIRDSKTRKWTGYISTTSVYGDYMGGTVKEDSTLFPMSAKDRVRRYAEQEWLQPYHGHVFRASGIYGPGRNVVDRLMKGEVVQIIHKEEHIFNRIHVHDLVQVIIASMKNPKKEEIYNCSDDLPCPLEDVYRYAYEICHKKAPPTVSFSKIQAELSPMMRGFFENNRRVCNEKIKKDLGVKFYYPTYKEGLKACLVAYQEKVKLSGQKEYVAV